MRGAVNIDKRTLADLEELTYYELSDLILSTYATMLDQFSVFQSVLFAYFVMAYLLAKKLSVFQLSSVSLVYSAFCIVAIAGYFNLADRLWDFVYFRDGEVSVALYSSAVVCIVGWLISLIFMLHARYKKGE